MRARDRRERVGVLAVARHAAAQHTVQLEMREQQHELLAGELDAAVGQGAGEVSSVRSDASARIASTASVSVVMRSASGRSCWPTVGSTRGAVSSSSHLASSACT